VHTGQEMASTPVARTGQEIPEWVPDGVRHYIAHIEGGQTIRALARAADVHASTILRQVRRFEALRDDPLIDRALRRLSASCASRSVGPESNEPGGRVQPRVAAATQQEGTGEMAGQSSQDAVPDIVEMESEGLRILRRLAEPGAVLAVARDMEMGVVVRDGDGVGTPQRLAIVSRTVAEAMALNDWICCESPEARVARYHITGAGRGALKRLVVAAGSRAQGYAEAQAALTGMPLEDPALRHMRTLLGESPLVGLARRQDRDGRPFLDRDLVAAAERLREDFELSQTGGPVAEDWEGFLQGALTRSEDLPADASGGRSDGALAARRRLREALGDLGPGLADVALRCCCLLEGLESLERRMGWSARSGKIVLRIALQRLNQHYLRTQGRFGPMIG
jgi:hypothetical protein